MGTIRKKILKKNAEVRRANEGKPREASNKRAMRVMMKDFNRYVERRLKIENVEELKKKVVTQEELGLPTEMSGEDLLRFIKSDKPKEPLVSAEWVTFDMDLASTTNADSSNPYSVTLNIEDDVK